MADQVTVLREHLHGAREETVLRVGGTWRSGAEVLDGVAERLLRGRDRLGGQLGDATRTAARHAFADTAQVCTRRARALRRGSRALDDAASALAAARSVLQRLDRAGVPVLPVLPDDVGTRSSLDQLRAHRAHQGRLIGYQHDLAERQRVARQAVDALDRALSAATATLRGLDVPGSRPGGAVVPAGVGDAHGAGAAETSTLRPAGRGKSSEPEVPAEARRSVVTAPGGGAGPTQPLSALQGPALPSSLGPGDAGPGAPHAAVPPPAASSSASAGSPVAGVAAGVLGRALTGPAARAPSGPGLAAGDVRSTGAVGSPRARPALLGPSRAWDTGTAAGSVAAPRGAAVADAPARPGGGVVGASGAGARGVTPPRAAGVGRGRPGRRASPERAKGPGRDSWLDDEVAPAVLRRGPDA